MGIPAPPECRLKVIRRPEPTLSASYNLGDRVCFIVGNTRPSALEDTMTEQTNPPLRGLIPHLTVRDANAAVESPENALNTSGDIRKCCSMNPTQRCRSS
jgi:hypothetical protein